MNVAQNKKIGPWLIHIIGWGILFGFPFFFAPRDGTTMTFERYLGHVFVPVSFMVVFYVNYFYLIDRVLFRKKLYCFILYNIALVALMCLLLRMWQEYYWVHFIPKPDNNRPHPPVWLFISRDFMLMALTAGFSVAIKVTSNWYRMEGQRKELEKSRAEAELKNLKSQLNPHFLFNTLNNIYSLISFSPEKAQHAVYDLSRLLRYVLYDDNQEKVPIVKDVEFIKNYVELMKIRLPKQVEIETDIVVESNMEVAPLLFIALIENAFKHGISSVEPSYIHMELRTIGEQEILCRIENTYFPKTVKDKSGSGIGLENLKKRLELLYPGKYTLLTGQKERCYVAELKIRI